MSFIKKLEPPSQGPRPGAYAEGGVDEEEEHEATRTAEGVVVRPIVEDELQAQVRDRLFGVPIEATSVAVEREEEAADRRPRRQRRRLLVGLAIVVAVLVVIGVALGFTLPTSSSPSTAMASAPTAAPVPELTASDVELLNLLRTEQTTLDYYGDNDPLDNTSSPQYRSFDTLREVWQDLSSADRLTWYALRCLYFSTRGDDWLRNSGWLTNTGLQGHCEWYSSRPTLACINSRPFSALALEDNHLVGTLPPELAYLSTHLSVLALDSNSLSSTVPSTFYRLTGLVELDLSSNPLLYGDFVRNAALAQMSKLAVVNVSETRLETTAP